MAARTSIDWFPRYVLHASIETHCLPSSLDLKVATPKTSLWLKAKIVCLTSRLLKHELVVISLFIKGNMIHRETAPVGNSLTLGII